MKASYILLVDDNDELRMMTADCLKALGFEIVQAKNGQEALDEITKKTTKFAAIISDYQMPLMDGGTMLRQIIKLDIPRPKIILTTSLFENDAEIVRLKQEVPLSFLSKPFHIDDIVHILMSAAF